MAKKKRNYRAERKAASDFADATLSNSPLQRGEWLQMWGIIYDARLGQIRGTLHPNVRRVQSESPK